MAAFNLLPSILDKTPYGGYRTGMADERAIMHSDRELLNQDLDNQRQQMVNKDFESAGPLRAAERALKLAEAEKLQTEMNNGTWEEDRKRKRQTEMEELAAKVSKRQIDELKLKVSGTEAIGQLFPDTNPAAMSMGWENARAIAKEYKFDIGEYNEQNAAKLAAMIKATPQAQKMVMDLQNHQQAMELKNLEFGQRYQTEWLRQEGATKRTEMAQTGATQRAQAAANKPGRTPPLTPANAKRELDIKGEQVSDVALDVIEQEITNKALTLEAQNPASKLNSLKAAMDAAKNDPKVMADLRAEMEAELDRLKAKAGGDLYAKVKAIKAKRKPSGTKATSGRKLYGNHPEAGAIYRNPDGTYEDENGTPVELE